MLKFQTQDEKLLLRWSFVIVIVSNKLMDAMDTQEMSLTAGGAVVNDALSPVSSEILTAEFVEFERVGVCLVVIDRK